ncbi:MAG: CBS domain-containing protein [Candidatus Thermoplasmatota archaeon]
MKVKDVMTTNVITVAKDDHLSHILDLMKKHRITKIPVVEGKKLLGIVTDNEIAYKLGSIRKRFVSASRLHASSVTEKDVMIVSPETDLSDILKMVGEPGPTMLPVLNNEKLVGVVTKADLLPLVKSGNQLRSIIQHPVHMIAPDDRVVHARRKMIEYNIARLPVTDEKHRLRGIISDFEIAVAFAEIKKSFSLGRQKHRLDQLLVADAMKTPVIFTNPDMSIAHAARLMHEEGVGALPLVQNDAVVGIISRTDVLKTISIEA